MPIQAAPFSKVLGDRSLAEAAEIAAEVRSEFGDYPVVDSATALLRCADGGTVAVDENETRLAGDRAFLEAVGPADGGDSSTREGETNR